ncbi:MAG: tyrosine-type recombinase/integrase [Planctomycetes bacterium]|nr:tyrosine-type recombinase/integrase [Planctomycetota bacterium]
MLFRFAYEAGLIDRPIRFGPQFKEPSRKTLRISRNQNGKRMFEADELRAILDVATQPLKAMIMLGINCGFGQSDIANLPNSAVDLDKRWIDYPRPKTSVERHVPLWPETLVSLGEAIARRPDPNNAADSECVFITKYGNRWVRTTDHDEPEKRIPLDSVAPAFAKVKALLDINGKRNFYAIRHTFATIAGESEDQVAVNAIIGHVDNTKAGVYRERISDERLRAVTDVVRRWLFDSDAKELASNGY